jgi:hypothetical protein
MQRSPREIWMRCEAHLEHFRGVSLLVGELACKVPRAGVADVFGAKVYLQRSKFLS